MSPNPKPETEPDGTIEEIDGRYVLRFVRRFPHPVERVWDALTTPERLTEWVGATEVELDLVVGGKMVSRGGSPELIQAIREEIGGDVPIEFRDTVLRVDPPLVFEHTFGGSPESIARWELEPDGDGCVLTLTHTEPPGFEGGDGPRDLSGWHMLLELLGHALDGRPVEWRRKRADELRARYVAKMRGGGG